METARVDEGLHRSLVTHLGAKRRCPGVTVALEGGYALLDAVETLPVGSARVARLPILSDLLTAQDDFEAMEGFLAGERALEAFAASLDRDGRGDVAAAVRDAIADACRNLEIMGGCRRAARSVQADRLNAGMLSALEWIYRATFTTAGATTEAVPWEVGGGRDEPVAPAAHPNGDASILTLAPETLERVAQANAVLYERVVGLANAVRRELGDGAEVHAMPDAVLAVVGGGARPRFDGPGDIKALLKVDYEFRAGGELAAVGVHAGFTGVYVDDLLCGEQSTPSPAADPWAGPAPLSERLARAVLGVFHAETGGLPRRIAVAVLDGQMYHSLWHDDLRGFVDVLGRVARDYGCPPAAIPVLAADGLSDLADHVGDESYVPPVMDGVRWTGLPDLIVLFSPRVAGATVTETHRRLRAGGVTLIDERHHAALCSRDVDPAELIGARLPAGVRVPERRRLRTIGEYATGRRDLVADLWRLARYGLRWPAVAVRVERRGRALGLTGDLPAPFVFPVTGVGETVARRQLARVLREIGQGPAAGLHLVACPVDTLGGLADLAGRRRAIGVRTYAYPKLRAQRG